jgi:hypothetical protein
MRDMDKLEELPKRTRIRSCDRDNFYHRASQVWKTRMNKLKGILHNSIGLFWSDVYSEISKKVKPPVGYSLRDMLDSCLIQHTFRIGNDLCYYYGGKILLVADEWTDTYYVDPLWIVRFHSHKKMLRRKKPVLRVKTEEGYAYSINGLWYEMIHYEKELISRGDKAFPMDRKYDDVEELRKELVGVIGKSFTKYRSGTSPTRGIIPAFALFSYRFPIDWAPTTVKQLGGKKLKKLKETLCTNGKDRG